MSTQFLTPRMAGVLERIRRANRPAFHTLSAEQARAAYGAGAEVLDLPRARLDKVEDMRVPGADGTELAARRYRPVVASRGTLLYLHGGGFTIGGLETHDSLCRQLALRSGAQVLALDYRLAPEHRFPTAVDDTLGRTALAARAGRRAGFRQRSPGRRRRQRRRHARRSVRDPCRATTACRCARSC
jgi:acetyl esterase